MRSLRSLSGADSVSLFLPATRSEDRGILLFEGESEPVPELSDEATAGAYALQTELRLDKVLTPAEAPIQLEGSGPGSRLVRLPSLDAHLHSATTSISEAGKRRTDGTQSARSGRACAWLGFRLAQGELRLPPVEASLRLTSSLHGKGVVGAWSWILAVGCALVWNSSRLAESLVDPVSRLPGRLEMQSWLAQAIADADALSQPVTLALVNPDDFGRVNQQLGREPGDQVIREISDRLRTLHRSSDLLARYGGATFAIILPDTSLADGRRVADKIQRELSERPFHDGVLRLSFSVGVATLQPGDESISTAIDLVHAADRALHAARKSSVAKTVTWEEGSEAQAGEGYDRLSGIFTADPQRDYHNMVLLLNTLQSMASQDDLSALLASVSAGISSRFGPRRLGVFELLEDGSLHLLHARVADERPGADNSTGHLELGPEERELVQRALDGARPALDSTEDTEGSPMISCAVPMIVGAKPVGCFFLDRHRSEPRFDRADVDFLAVVATQIAYALDRTRLAQRERARQEGEQRRLEAEVENLRGALAKSKMLYRSAEMEAVVAMARRVAGTDATVMITGESGTGKELLARAIHDLSPRRKGPQIIVDCTAVPDTLFESELFGHEKGAFTGADRRKKGRVLEANGGTVLLDEIGELPLAVQGKLLRFVQEKQMTPVGSSKSMTVDARIVASTNRDLGEEVSAGRFREDLFHRLNVFRLEIPPLRRRPDDTLFLAQHFLEVYAALYGRGTRSLTAEAENLLLSYHWPGNVRELQHCIMRAVLLSERETIGPAALTFFESDEAVLPRIDEIPRPDRQGTISPSRADRPSASRDDHGTLRELSAAVGRLVERIAAEGPEPIPPIGSWLADEILHAVDARVNGVRRQGAALLRIPETTYRRRLGSAEKTVPIELAWVGEWDEIRAAVAELAQDPPTDESGLLQSAEQILLQAIHRAYPGDVRRGAALLGVSAPTYRKRSRALS